MVLGWVGGECGGGDDMKSEELCLVGEVPKFMNSTSKLVKLCNNFDEEIKIAFFFILFLFLFSKHLTESYAVRIWNSRTNGVPETE